MKVTASPLLIAGLALSTSTLAIPVSTSSNNLEVRSPNPNDGDRSPRVGGGAWGSARSLPAAKWGRRELPTPPDAVPSAPAAVGSALDKAPVNPVGGAVQGAAPVTPFNAADAVAQIKNYVPIDPSAHAIPVPIPGTGGVANSANHAGAINTPPSAGGVVAQTPAASVGGTPAAMIFTAAGQVLTSPPATPLGSAKGPFSQSPAGNVPIIAGSAIGTTPAGSAGDAATGAAASPINLLAASPLGSLVDIHTDLDLARLILAAQTGLVARDHPRDFLKRDLLSTPLGVLNTATGTLSSLADNSGSAGPLAAPLQTVGGLVGGLSNTATGLLGSLPAPVGAGLNGIVTPLTNGLVGGLNSGDPLALVGGTVNGALGAVSGVTQLANGLLGSDGLLGGLLPLNTLASPLAATSASTSNPAAGLGGLGGTINGLLGTVGGVAHTATGLVGGLLPDPLGGAVNGLGETLDGTLTGLTGTLTGPAPVSGLVGSANGLVHGVAGALPLGLGNTVTGLTDGLLGPSGLVGGLGGTLDGVVGGVTGGLLGGLLGGGATGGQAANGGLLGGLLGGGGNGLLGGLLGGSAPAPAAAAGNLANVASAATAAPPTLQGAAGGITSIPGGLVANLGNGRFLTGAGAIVDLSGIIGKVSATAQGVAAAPLAAVAGVTAGTPLAGTYNTAQSVAGVPLGMTQGIAGMPQSAAGSVLGTAQAAVGNTPLVAVASTPGNIFNSPAGAAGFASGTLVSAADNSAAGPAGPLVESATGTVTSGKPPMSPEATALARKIAAASGLDPNTILAAIGTPNPINAIQSLLMTSADMPIANLASMPLDPSTAEGTPANVLIGQQGQIVDSLPSLAGVPTATSIFDGAPALPTGATEQQVGSNMLPYPVPAASNDELDRLPPVADANADAPGVVSDTPTPTGGLPATEPIPTLFDIAAPIVGDWASSSSILPSMVSSGVESAAPTGAVGGLADLA